VQQSYVNIYSYIVGIATGYGLDGSGIESQRLRWSGG
jgi:hypothetical protein